MSRKILIVILLLSVFSIQGFSQFGFYLNEDKRRVQIPFQIHSNLIVVPIILNQRMPLKFVLDTGVRNAILTEKDYSDILSIPYTRKFSIRGVGEEQMIDAYLTSSVSLGLPGVDGKGHVMLVLEQDYIQLRNFLGTEVHGLIGYELFSRFIVEINYQRKLITLHDPERFKKPASYRTLDLTMEDTKPYVQIPVTLDDGSTIMAKLLIDTGASHGIMLDPSSGDSVRVSQKAIDANIGRGLGGDIEGQIGRIKGVEFAGYTVENPIATFPYPNSYLDSLIGKVHFRNGSLGGDFLGRFNVILDYSHGKMYLKKNSEFKRKFFYNLSGLTVMALGADLNVFQVSDIRKSSDAWKAGVRTGDLIMSVNGMRTTNAELKYISALLNSKPGKKVRLILKRGEEEFEVKFSLQSAI